MVHYSDKVPHYTLGWAAQPSSTLEKRGSISHGELIYMHLLPNVRVSGDLAKTALNRVNRFVCAGKSLQGFYYNSLDQCVI